MTPNFSVWAATLPAQVVTVREGIRKTVVLHRLSAERRSAAGGAAENIAVDVDSSQAGSDLRTGDSRRVVRRQAKLARRVRSKIDEAATAESCTRLVHESVGDDVGPVDREARVRAAVRGAEPGRNRHLAVTVVLAANRKAAREVVLRTQLAINANVTLVVVRRARPATHVVVRQVAGGNVRQRIDLRMREEVLRHRIDHANGLSQRRSISSSHGGCGNAVELRAAAVLPRALVVEEEEETIMNHRPAKRSAEDAAVQRRHRANRCRVGRVLVRPAIRVHVLVFKKPERVAVEAVRSRLRDHHDLAAICITVLCRCVAADDADLADGIHIRAVVDVIVDRVINVDTVQRVVVRLLTISVDKEAAVVGRTPNIVCIHRRSRNSARRKSRERGEITGLQWEFGGLRRCDRSACARIFRVQDGSRGGHDHILIERADLQPRIHLRFLAYFEAERTNRGRAEAHGFNGQLVMADLQKTQNINAIRIGRRGSLNTSINIRCGDFG